MTQGNGWFGFSFIVGSMGRKFPSLVLCLSSLFAAGQAHAARDGSLGPVSTGSINISASIAPRVQISAPTDMVFDHLGKATTSISQRLCLSSNWAPGSFVVSAIGSGDGGALVISNGYQSVGYTVRLAAHESVIPIDNGQAGVKLGAATSPEECEQGTGAAALIVGLDAARLHEVSTGAPYIGALTLIIAPE
jgi:hypothetical protein